ncbi:hypothetical protein ACFLSX_04745 [Calditrichota bacterium]
MIIYLFCFTLYAQYDEKTFFSRVNSIYHNLESTNIENFALAATSDFFEISTNEFLDNDSYFPVEVIWVSPNKMYFLKKTFPADLDTSKKKIVFQLQKDMQQGLKGILIDWQRFLGGKILDDLPENFKVTNIDDTVHVEFEAIENNIPVYMKFYFGINALCFKIETTYKNSNQKMITLPAFVLIKNKWLCTKWTVKIIKNGEIESGFIVELKSQARGESWFPLQTLITVQTKEKLNETFRRIYKFRKLEINKDLKYLDY